MSPTVFICGSIDQLVKHSGAGEYIPLSDLLPINSSGAKILKNAAPLCFGNWKIYVERSEDGRTCKYGVFCGSSDPSSMTIDEVVLDTYNEKFPVVRVVQNATNKVEVRSSVGRGIEFRFNNDQDVSEIKSRHHISQLAKAISAKSGPLSDAFEAYVERTLSAAVKYCHGTLIAVLPSQGPVAPAEISDMLLLQPSFHLYERLDRHTKEGKTAESVSRLQAASELVSGFIESDGITVFNDAGYIVGYRAFVKSDGSAVVVNGGARTRAYEALKALIGKGVSAAFFRSQDGRTDYVEEAKELKK